MFARLRPAWCVVGAGVAAAAAPALPTLRLEAAESSGRAAAVPASPLLAASPQPAPYPVVERHTYTNPAEFASMPSDTKLALATWDFFVSDITQLDSLRLTRETQGVRVYARADDPLHGDNALSKSLQLDKGAKLADMKNVPQELRDRITAALQEKRVWRAAETVVRVPVDVAVDLWSARSEWEDGKHWQIRKLPPARPWRPGVMISVVTERHPLISNPRQFLFHVRQMQDVPCCAPGSVALLYSPMELGMEHLDRIYGKAGVVRGQATAVVLMEPVTADSTRIVYAFCIDYCGKLPALAFDGAADEEAGMLLAFSKYADARVHGHP